MHFIYIDNVLINLLKKLMGKCGLKERDYLCYGKQM